MVNTAGIYTLQFTPKKVSELAHTDLHVDRRSAARDYKRKYGNLHRGHVCFLQRHGDRLPDPNVQ